MRRSSFSSLLRTRSMAASEVHGDGHRLRICLAPLRPVLQPKREARNTRARSRRRLDAVGALERLPFFGVDDEHPHARMVG